MTNTKSLKQLERELVDIALTEIAPTMAGHRSMHPKPTGLAADLKKIQIELLLCCLARDTSLTEVRHNLRRLIAVASRMLLEGDTEHPHTVPPSMPDPFQSNN